MHDLFLILQVALGLLAIPAAILIVLGFVIYEPRTSEDIHLVKKKVSFHKMQDFLVSSAKFSYVVVILVSYELIFLIKSRKF